LKEEQDLQLGPRDSKQLRQYDKGLLPSEDVALKVLGAHP
tara:strand:+ start:448 stop:567 length:120 start_codon:yes stop_codon:yes gene_type:complete